MFFPHQRSRLHSSPCYMRRGVGHLPRPFLPIFTRFFFVEGEDRLDAARPSSPFARSGLARLRQTIYSPTNLPGLTLRPRIELVPCFDFVLLAPSLSTGPLSAPSCYSFPVTLTFGDLVPRRQCDSFGQNWLCTWGVVALLFPINLYTH